MENAKTMVCDAVKSVIVMIEGQRRRKKYGRTIFVENVVTL